MRGDPAYFELLNVPTLIDPIQWEGKAKLVKIWQDMFALIDAAGLCVFFSVRNLFKQELELPPEGIMEYLNAATGAEYTLEELRQIGERIANAERMFLNRAGFTRKDDSLPSRLIQDPMPEGPAKGSVCHLEEMLEEYYQIQNWDHEGKPKPEKLRELGLG